MRTVANQARAVYRKLGVTSRAELAARARGAAGAEAAEGSVLMTPPAGPADEPLWAAGGALGGDPGLR